jgi:hypothetical protein
MKNIKALFSDEEHPPQGNITVVCMRIFGAESLWDELTEDFSDILTSYNKIVKNVFDFPMINTLFSYFSEFNFFIKNN